MKNLLVLFVIVLSITPVLYGQEKVEASNIVDGELRAGFLGPPSAWVEISQAGILAYENWLKIILGGKSTPSFGAYNMGRVWEKVVYFFPMDDDGGARTSARFDGQKVVPIIEDEIIDIAPMGDGALIMTTSGILLWDNGDLEEVIPGTWDPRYQVRPGQQKISVIDNNRLAIKQGAESLLYFRQKDGSWKLTHRLSASSSKGDTSVVSEIYLTKTEKGLVVITLAGDAIWVYKEKLDGTFMGCFKKGFEGPYEVVDEFLVSGNLLYDLNDPAFDTEGVDFTGKPLVELEFDFAGRDPEIIDVDAVCKEGTGKQVLLVAISAKGDYYKNLPNRYWIFEVPIRRVPEPAVTTPKLGGAFWEESTIHVGNSTNLTLHVVARPKGVIEEVLVNGKPIRAARNKGAYFRKLKVNKNTKVEVTFRERDKTEKKFSTIVPREELSIVGIRNPKWKENLGYKFNLLPGKYKVVTEGSTEWYTLLVRNSGRGDFKPKIN